MSTTLEREGRGEGGDVTGIQVEDVPLDGNNNTAQENIGTITDREEENTSLLGDDGVPGRGGEEEQKNNQTDEMREARNGGDLPLVIFSWKATHSQ